MEQVRAFLGAASLAFGATMVLAVVVLAPFGWRPRAGSTAWKWAHPLAVGANVPGLTHMPREDLARYLDEMQRLGFSVVRVYPARADISDDESARRLDALLTAAEARGISVLVPLIDYYNSRRNPAGTDKYYTGYWQTILYLNHDFMAEAYRGRYEDFVRTVVSANRQHRNIYAWEPGNELQDQDPATFLHFMQEVSAVIKHLDPAHPVASGMIESRQASLTPQQMYSVLPDVDIVAIHPGNGYRGSAVDIQWALAHGRKGIVEETGFSSTADRTSELQTELDYWWQMGVSAFLVDSFIARGMPDNGQGDRLLGVDTVWHTDYESIGQALRSAAKPWPLAV